MIPATVVVATVSLSVSVHVRYVEARCPTCSRHLISVPAPARLEMRVRAEKTDLSGRGIATKCDRCKSLVEVIRHG